MLPSVILQRKPTVTDGFKNWAQRRQKWARLTLQLHFLNLSLWRCKIQLLKWGCVRQHSRSWHLVYQSKTFLTSKKLYHCMIEIALGNLPPNSLLNACILPVCMHLQEKSICWYQNWIKKLQAISNTMSSWIVASLATCSRRSTNYDYFSKSATKKKKES